MQTDPKFDIQTARINGVEVMAADIHALQAAAVQELLWQEAREQGLAPPDADEQAQILAVEELLEREIEMPHPDEHELQRYYHAHLTRYAAGELVFASHILLQMTPGTPVQALLARAEGILHYLQQHSDHFAQSARENSNCPSAEIGGSLGQLQRGETVPEFEAALFADQSVGLWPQLVRTRFGFHILRIDRREPGKQLPFDLVRERVAHDLQQAALAKALTQYVQILAGQASVEGVQLGATQTPLVN